MCARIIFISVKEAIYVTLGNLFNLSELHLFSMYKLRIKVGPISWGSCVESMKMHAEMPHMVLRIRKHCINGPAVPTMQYLFSRSIDLEVDELSYAVDILNPNLHYGKNHMVSITIKIILPD